MKKIINIFLIALVLIAFFFVIFKPDWIVAGPPPIRKDAVLISDRCPANEYLQGIDKETGNPVCANPPTGCHYAEQVLVGPECDRLAPQQSPAPAQQIDPPSLPTFQGK